MLKKLNKRKALFLVFAVCMIFVAVGVSYASYYIYSSITTPVQVGGYTVPLTSSFDGGTMTISGSLKRNGVGVVGASIEIFTNATEGEGSPLSNPLATVTTVENGAFTHSYQPANGTYRYQARYTIPSS